MDFSVLTTGALTSLIVEGLKKLIKLILKKEFDFPPLFYVVAIPILNALVPFALIWLGVEAYSPVAGLDWLEALKYLILVALSSLISVGTYNVGIKPLKTYAREYSVMSK